MAQKYVHTLEASSILNPKALQVPNSELLELLALGHLDP